MTKYNASATYDQGSTVSPKEQERFSEVFLGNEYLMTALIIIYMIITPPLAFIAARQSNRICQDLLRSQGQDGIIAQLGAEVFSLIKQGNNDNNCIYMA